MLRFGIEHDDDLKLAGWSSEAVCKYLKRSRGCLTASKMSSTPSVLHFLHLFTSHLLTNIMIIILNILTDILTNIMIIILLCFGKKVC